MMKMPQLELCIFIVAQDLQGPSNATLAAEWQQAKHPGYCWDAFFANFWVVQHPGNNARIAQHTSRLSCMHFSVLCDHMCFSRVTTRMS